MTLLDWKDFKKGKRAEKPIAKAGKGMKALDELVKQSQELGLYENYENPMIKDRCIGCNEPYMPHIDNDPNGERNASCIKCRTEESHDFDLEPDAQIDRFGNTSYRFSKINEATEEEILSIKGVGRKTCDMLLSFLESDQFKSEEDLKKAGLNTRSINLINLWIDAK
jgi:hypothetical protein